MGRTTLTEAALATALTVALYSVGLGLSPPHLTHDEIKFALQAKSIADTGRDINGRFLPLYFQEPGFSVGRDPICIYVMAAVLTVLPLSEQSIRLSTALVGAAGVGLIFVLARLLFERRSIAWIVAGIMALSPTYYIHSRLALSVLYPVPFTIAWLIALRRHLAVRRPASALAVGLALGIGVYSYLAAAVMMPVYLALTAVLLATDRDWRGLAAVVTGFAVLLVPLAVWQAIEPQRYANILTAYRLYDTEPGARSGLLQQLLSVEGLTNRVQVYWVSFNPGRLFFTGESSLQISTREVGSLLTPVAVFLVIGLVEVLRAARPVAWLFAAGLLSAPLPGVLMADVEIRRWLVLLPFVAIVAGYGVQRLLAAGAPARALVGVLVVAMAIQFAAFTRDYFGPYRERSSTWFGGNIRAAIEAVLTDARGQPPAAVYIASDIPWVDAYWQFYTAAQGQAALRDRATYVRLASGEVPKVVQQAILVAPADAALVASVEGAGWITHREVRDLDGSPSIIIFAAPPH